MFIEEFYNYDGKSDEQIIRIIYETTLTSWLIFNEEDVYLEMIEFFEEQEDYLACEGVKRAVDKINDIMDKRFDEVSDVDEDEILMTSEEHKNVSKLIYQDILKEIYENRIRTIKGND
jgi:hypothetical protein